MVIVGLLIGLVLGAGGAWLAVRAHYAAKLGVLQDARASLEGTMRTLAHDALASSSESFLALAKSQLEQLQAKTTHDLDQRKQAVVVNLGSNAVANTLPAGGAAVDAARADRVAAVVVDGCRRMEGLLAEFAGDESALMHEACRANVRASANQLRHGSEIIERLCAEEGLLIVGAEYSLETGVVDVFEKP